MFVNISKLEKILKAEYRAFGVSFGKTEKGMYLMNGTGWIIEVDEECVTKEFLGTVIKAIGAQTYRCGFCRYQKDTEPQRELEREPVLWNDAESATAVMISKIKIEQQDKLYSIVKTPGGAQMLSDIRYAMIDYSKMKSDEDVPVGPVVKDDWIIWYSNAMAIGIRFTDPMYKPQLETLRLLSGVDFNWKETPVYQIQR